jgi:two-component system, cell cycle sensor histidine kinase and response regulator CckA
VGYNVLSAGTPGQAMDLAGKRAGGVDLLITDVIMPEMNGRELSAKLGMQHPGLKTLFMSGYTANVIVHRGILEQGMYFIQKPFSAHDLAVKVRNLLDQCESASP